jgi:DNA-binding SARP family transcriptional activator
MHLAIQLLGSPQFQLDDVPVTASRRAVLALMAYLTVTDLEHPGQRSSRDSLAELFWTDYEPAKALTNLRHTIWEVTKFVGEGWVMAEHETIYLNPRANTTLDVAQFRSLLHQVAQQADPALRIPLLRNAAEHYRDDFLKDFSLKDGSSFNDWVVSKAATLRHEFASALELLVEDYSALHQAQSAIPHAQRLIELDPLDEAAHRRLMQLYALTDQQAAAIQQYRALEALLRKELNLDPQPETRQLYKEIRKGEFRAAAAEKKIVGLEKTKPKHNLPVHLTTFVGREKESHEIARLIAQNRLVTLTGAGGIGKTRLALQTGHSLLDRYPDGICSSRLRLSRTKTWSLRRSHRR